MNIEKLEYFRKVLDELQKAGIVPYNIGVGETSEEDELTVAYPALGMILLNFEELENLPLKLAEMTAQHDEDVLMALFDDDIAFFHELGHIADFNITFKGDVQAFRLALLEQEAVTYAKDVLITNFCKSKTAEEIQEMEDDIEVLEAIAYRSTPFEKRADEFAYDMMKKYLSL
jgi:hypothetical protein